MVRYPTPPVRRATERLRISFFTQWWPPEPANVVASLATELSRRGHDLSVVTGFPNYPSGHLYAGYRMRLRQVEQSARVRTTRVPLFPSHDRSSTRRVANYLTFAAAASTVGLASVGKSDVAYVYHPPITSAWPARIQGILRKVPFVLHVQDLWPESVVQSGMVGSTARTEFVERALNRACSAAYRSASHIIVISEGFKRILVDRGVPQHKVSVVHNWADESVFGVHDADPRARAELGPPNARIVLYAGNLGDYQGLDQVVNAAGRFRGRLHLTLIGEGIARQRLERLIEERRIENVAMLPRRPAADMPRLLAAADVHLVSLADQPFFAATIPGKTQVALASGKPLIIGVRGDAAKLTADADAGFACSPTAEGFSEAFEAMLGLSSGDLRDRGLSGRTYYEDHLAMRHGGDAFERILHNVAARIR